MLKISLDVIVEVTRWKFVQLNDSHTHNKLVIQDSLQKTIPD
jgi:hypothetical protein